MLVVPKKKHERVVKEKNYEIEKLKDRLNEVLLENCDLEKKLKKANDEVFILRTFLSIEADKTIKRYENIKKRTKKIRTKNKCDRNIEDYMMRKLAYKQT